MKKIILAALSGALVLVSCKKEEVEPTTDTNNSTPVETLNLIGSATTTNNETVELYANTATIETGYTNLYIKIKDDQGNNVSNATVSITPKMDMGTMVHSSPVEQPSYNSTESYYKGVVVFTMSSTAGTWTIDIDVNGSIVPIEVNVVDAPTKVCGVYTGTDGVTYIVSLVKPITWEVGMNNFSITIHKKESMMSFPAVDGLTVILDPEMVSMGHGSPNNISPVNTSNGYYTGEVNFTMTGDWRLHLELQDNGTVLHSDAFLDILF